MLHFLSSEAKCKSFSPLKIVFSGERKIGFSSLGLLWYFAAQTEYVQAAVGLGFAAMWLRQVKNRVLKCTRKLCHPLVLLFCKNNLRRLLLEQGDSRFTASCPSRVLQCHETPSSQRRSGGWLCNACVYSCTFNSSFANLSLQI